MKNNDNIGQDALQPFEGYLQETYQRCLNEPSENNHPFDATDQAFLDALKRYLQSEGAESIDVPELVPDDLPNRVARMLDVDAVNRQQNGFNSGEEALKRAVDNDSHLALAELYQAAERYLQDNQQPIKVGWDRFLEPETLSKSQREPGLWRQVSDDAVEQTEALDLDQPVVICLTGIGGVSANQAELAGIMQQAARQVGEFKPDLKGKPEQIQFYTLSHPTVHRMQLAYHTSRYNAQSRDYVIPYAQEMFDRFIKPHFDPLFDRNDYDPSQLKATARKFNFYAYSMGTVVVRCFATAMADYLKEKQVGDEDIKSVLAEVFALNVSPTHRLDDAKAYGHFTTVHAISKNDNTARSRGYHDRILKDPSQTPQVVKIADNEIMIWTDGPKSGVFIEPLTEGDVTQVTNTQQAAGAKRTPIAVGKNELAPSANGRIIERLGEVPDSYKAGHRSSLITSRILEPDNKGSYRLHDPGYVESALKYAVRKTKTLGSINDLFSAIKEKIRFDRYDRPLLTIPERLGRRRGWSQVVATNDDSAEASR